MKPVKPSFRLVIGILSLPFFVISSCKKENSNTLATIINSGDRAVDGCGWLVKINNTDSLYSPVNLPDTYKINNQQVLISYTKLNSKFGCGMIPYGGQTEIKLGSIKKD